MEAAPSPLATLRAGLAAAKEIAEAPTKQPSGSFDTAGADRLAALKQLDTLMDFVEEALGTAESYLLFKPLVKLKYGLIDLDAGSVVPSLRPRRNGRKSRTSATDQAFRGIVAVVMELLFRSGLTIDAASKSTARMFNNRASRRNPISASQIKDWRNTAMEGLAKESLLAARYARMLDQLGNIGGPSALHAAQGIVRSFSS